MNGLSMGAPVPWARMTVVAASVDPSRRVAGADPPRVIDAATYS
jgi:hypothetical protein